PTRSGLPTALTVVLVRERDQLVERFTRLVSRCARGWIPLLPELGHALAFCREAKAALVDRQLVTLPLVNQRRVCTVELRFIHLAEVTCIGLPLGGESHGLAIHRLLEVRHDQIVRPLLRLATGGEAQREPVRPGRQPRQVQLPLQNRSTGGNLNRRGRRLDQSLAAGVADRNGHRSWFVTVGVRLEQVERSSPERCQPEPGGGGDPGVAPLPFPRLGQGIAP